MSKKSLILDRILTEATDFKRQNRNFLAVFDLDSTLLDVNSRMLAIVEDFAGSAQNRTRFPAECRALAALEFQRSDWGIGAALQRLGLSEETHPRFHSEIILHWKAMFFSNHYLHHDEPLPGAVDFVCRLHAMGAHIMYLTGRDVPRMLTGSADSLRDLGFPLNDQTTSLVLKPSASMDDAKFKVDVLRNWKIDFERIWFFENEPVNLNLAAKHLPDVQLVFIDSVHSGREQAPVEMERIVHFKIDSRDS